MSSTLIVENNEHLESLYALNLRLYVGVDECSIKKKGSYAVKFFQEGERPDLVICRQQIGQEKTAEIIFESLEKISPSIPLIILGNPTAGLQGKPNVHFLRISLNLKPLLKLVAKILGVTAKSMADQKVEDYFPIPVHYFTSIANCVCNIYAADIQNEGNYLKIFSANEEIPEGSVKSLISNGHANLYVDKFDRLKFTNNVTFNITETLDLNSLDDNDQLYVSEVANNQLADQLRTVGITEETSKLAKKNMNTVEAVAKRHSNLATLMKKLLNNQAGFLFKHVQILTYVTHQMMQHMDWGNEEQEKTLAFMAYFHDIVLETDMQAMIHSKKELTEANLPKDERELVNTHAQKAADLVVDFREAPHGVASLIRQHHGVLNGYGFTETYSGNVSPLSILFIVAEEYTRKLLMTPASEKINIRLIMLELSRTFKSHRFAKILAALEKIVIYDEEEEEEEIDPLLKI